MRIRDGFTEPVSGRLDGRPSQGRHSVQRLLANSFEPTPLPDTAASTIVLTRDVLRSPLVKAAALHDEARASSEAGEWTDKAVRLAWSEWQNQEGNVHATTLDETPGEAQEE